MKKYKYLYTGKERNGFYYSADLNLLPIDPNEWLHSDMPRHWECVIQKIDSWCGFMAMWSGLATKERAVNNMIAELEGRSAVVEF